MKKIILALLAITMILSAVSCDEGTKAEQKKEEQTVEAKAETKEDKKTEVEKTEDKKTEEKTEEKKPASNKAEVAIESKFVKCVFADEVVPTDMEAASSSFPKKEGKVYVDLVIKATNVGSKAYTDPYLTGYVMYDSVKYDLQCKMENPDLTSFTSLNIAVGETRNVHMIALLPEEAKSQNLTAIYSHGSETGEHKVSLAAAPTRHNKTRLSEGDTVKVDDAFTVEVLEVKTAKAFGASDEARTKQYTLTSGLSFSSNGSDAVEAFCVRLKITNNSPLNLTAIYAYTVSGDTIKSAMDLIETKDGTELEDMSTSIPRLIAPDKDGTVLLVAAAEGSDGMMRFNLNGTCYYVQ